MGGHKDDCKRTKIRQREGLAASLFDGDQLSEAGPGIGQYNAYRKLSLLLL